MLFYGLYLLTITSKREIITKKSSINIPDEINIEEIEDCNDQNEKEENKNNDEAQKEEKKDNILIIKSLKIENEDKNSRNTETGKIKINQSFPQKKKK